MNRSALCIRMLQILSAYDFVTTKELAEKLETNPRNILELKKELEVAGYSIESIKGRFGGYRLLERPSLSLMPLSEDEKQAMNEGYSFLKSHSDFLPIHEYTRAIEKIKASMVFQDHQSEIVYQSRAHKINSEIQKMIQTCEQAKKASLTIGFEYRSLHASTYKQVELCPYEILNIKGSYYCLGYCHEYQEYRTYKFSQQRMKNMTISDKKFTRDRDFDINAYLGKSGLMKDEVVEVEFLIRGENAILYAESEIGINSQMVFDENRCLHVKTLFEGKMNAMQFLCSLGSSCVVLSPKELKEEIKEEIRKMVQNYNM